MKIIQKILCRLILIACLSLLAACGGDGIGGTGIVVEPIANAEGRLVRSDEDSLLSYFQESIKRSHDYSDMSSEALEDGAPVAVDSSSGDVNLSGVSSTNIQESGVDEADLIKTNGRYIYSVKKTNAYSYYDAPEFITDLPEVGVASTNDASPSDSIRIMDTQDVAGITEVKNLKDDDAPWSVTGLYLHEAKQQLIALSSEKQNYYSNWFDSFSFFNRSTDVLLVDVAEPSTASVKTKISFDGQLIDSRRNGDTLYMVLRNYPNYSFVDEEALLAATNEDFLPHYSIGNSASQLITCLDPSHYSLSKFGKLSLARQFMMSLQTEQEIT